MLLENSDLVGYSVREDIDRQEYYDLLFNHFKEAYTDHTVAEAFTKVERAKREWESTVDALPELVCVVDEDGGLIRANRTVERWSLGTVKDVRGRELHGYLHPDCELPCYLERFLSSASLKVRESGPVELEAYDKVLRRNLHIRVLSVHYRTHDEHRHLVVIVEDITRRKEMEYALSQNNDRLKVLNTISGAILAARSEEETARVVLKHIRPLIPFQLAYVILNDPKGDGMSLLAAAERGHFHDNVPFPLDRETFAIDSDRHISELLLVGDLSRVSHLTLFEKCLRDQGINSYLSVPLSADNADIGFFAVGMERHHAFEAVQIQTVREAAEMLTVAVRQAQLTRQLIRTNDELQSLLRVKHEVMQDVSHELKSPLALIRGFTELLKDEVLGPLTHEQIRALDVLESKGDQILLMVNQLLALHTAGESTLDKELLSLGALLTEEYLAWQLPAQNNNVRLLLDVPDQVPQVMADAHALRRVVSNLLDNALKYSEPGDSVQIRLWTAGDSISFCIDDQGAGIKPEALERVFDRFYQAHRGTAQAKTGVGIGLALCKAIAEAHGGRIEAQSSGEGRGATFTVTLPIGHTPAAEKEEP